MSATQDSGTTTSIWQQGAAAADTSNANMPPLEGDAACDVCVIGAGIAGLTTAYLLARAGRDVLLIDDNAPGGGESIRTTAHLNNYIDDGLSDVEKVHGEEGMKLAVQSHGAAIDLVEQICRDEGIDAHVTRREEALFVAPDGYGQDYLDQEFDAAKRAGLPNVRFEDRAPQMPGHDTGRCLMFGGQATFHASRYYAGLVGAIQKHAGRLRLAHASGDIAGDHVITSDGKTIRCGWTATCTNAPINASMADAALIHSRQAPYRTYVVALRLPQDQVPELMFSDTLSFYHYVRPAHDGVGPVLVVGGEDHKTGHHTNDPGDAPARFDRLERWTRERWPQCREVVTRWSGQWMETYDYLAFIGQNVGNDKTSLISAGDSGMGITHGTLGGMILSDLVLGRPNPYADLYSPPREPMALQSTGEFLKEQADVMLQYRDYLTGGEVSEESEIAPGSGALIRSGLKKLAVYRDEAGQVHKHSAICPHMGCIVHWNSLEKSWDCPCHGSRFNCADGHVLHGPTSKGLSEA